MKTLVFILGTRPEAIKLAPVILEAKKRGIFRIEVILSSQHPEMCIQTLQNFGINPTTTLESFRDGQGLVSFSSKILGELSKLVLPWKESIVIVQGDTTTATMGAYAGFLLEAKVVHVEAGLRTYERDPFPEELNRILISKLVSFHFCATEGNRLNLQSEGILDEQIAVVGNTVVDAIKFFKVSRNLDVEKKSILITLHRRENHKNIINETTRIIDELVSESDPLYQWKFIKHPNPMAQAGYDSKFKLNSKIEFLDPVPYPKMLAELSKSYLVLTDSGGFQEESSFLGIPTLVLRKTTERPEALLAGCCELIAEPSKTLKAKVREILTNEVAHQKMSTPSTAFGNGDSAAKILQILTSF
jgi:UDP-N-acetylglucosamine 2-epimerase (non-hydrolysing)